MLNWAGLKTFISKGLGNNEENSFPLEVNITPDGPKQLSEAVLRKIFLHYQRGQNSENRGPRRGGGVSNIKCNSPIYDIIHPCVLGIYVSYVSRVVGPVTKVLPSTKLDWLLITYDSIE